MRVIHEGTGEGERKIYKYEMLSPEETEKSLERLVALKDLALRLNAQVMLIQVSTSPHPSERTYC